MKDEFDKLRIMNETIAMKEVDNIFRALKRYIRTEERDRIHKINMYVFSSNIFDINALKLQLKLLIY